MTFTAPTQDADAATEVSGVDEAFLYQFREVDKAIANFTKHQPFNHHYAPNVHMNRGRNNHHHHHNNNNNNSGRQNSGNGYNHGNNNNNGNNSNNGSNNSSGMFQSPANFAMTAQLKQQQHQQFLNQGLQNIKRLKSSNGLLSSGSNQQMKSHQLQQQQQQQQQVYMPSQQQQQQQVYMPSQQQQQYYDNRSVYNGNSLQASNFYSGNPLMNNFSAFQNQSTISTADMLSPLRTSPPAFSTGFTNGSRQFGSPQFNGPFDNSLERTSSLGMNGSGFLNVTSPNQSGSSSNLNVNNSKFQLEQSNSGYLGNIWGDSKPLGGSTSVWA